MKDFCLSRVCLVSSHFPLLTVPGESLLDICLMFDIQKKPSLLFIKTFGIEHVGFFYFTLGTNLFFCTPLLDNK